MKNLAVSRSKMEITLNDTIYLVIFDLIYGSIHGSVDITHESLYSINEYEVKILRYCGLRATHKLSLRGYNIDFTLN